jgi:hypothetical protein
LFSRVIAFCKISEAAQSYLSALSRCCVAPSDVGFAFGLCACYTTLCLALFPSLSLSGTTQNAGTVLLSLLLWHWSHSQLCNTHGHAAACTPISFSVPFGFLFWYRGAVFSRVELHRCDSSTQKRTAVEQACMGESGLSHPRPSPSRLRLHPIYARSSPDALDEIFLLLLACHSGLLVRLVSFAPPHTRSCAQLPTQPRLPPPHQTARCSESLVEHKRERLPQKKRPALYISTLITPPRNACNQ